MDYIQLTTEQQQLITSSQAWHYHIVPKSSENGSLFFYIDEQKLDESIQDELELLYGKSIILDQRPSETITKTLGRYYRKTESQSNNKASITTDLASDDFLSKLIHQAWSLKSSDIHIETYEERSRVRMRIDGKLIERYILSKTEYPALINKIKIKSNLDIAEKRLPQDGRMMFNLEEASFDIRVSILPSLHGEKAVLRLLSKESTNIEIESLGFLMDQLQAYREGIKKPHGIVMISGPTGSGKTTTLYATLKILNNESTNLLTIEDPIEYTLEGINQVQLKESIGLTFASALRSFLRQDPDIIMLGEIRDAETARMAIRAALTGHLVLSTVHTNSAWGTISRLIDMGIPAYLLSDTLNLTVAQRLVRLLCPKCKKQKMINKKELPPGVNYINKWHYTAQGCEHCFYTGYKGRKAVYEVIGIDETLSQMIKTGEMEITEYLNKNKVRTMRDVSLEMLKNGETSLEEIYGILVSSM